ncbi:MAG: 2-hydroxy-3-oxopropionate reductase [Lachnospiraceae bacterium]|nr:2-hydroxy-3-oxopropionate reductase [Lachnospiraceae bacterium]
MIGFIGLGIMGRPMSKNLLKAGYSLKVFDLNKNAVEDVVKAGAEKGDSIEEVAKGSSIIITMLPNSPQVEEVVLGKGGVLETAQEGTVLIDMSSIAPLASRKIAEKCKENGIKMLDAPVSGGEPKAVDGTLSIMVGGEEALFLEMKELLLKMGSSVVYCGSNGAGNTTKLANQVIVALNIAACAEAYTMARMAGVDPETVYAAIRGGLAGSTVMDAKIPMMLEQNFEPGFKIDLHIKDLNNALETAHQVGAPMLLSAQVMEMFQQLHADGLGQKDHSALAEYYKKLSGTAIGEKI